MDRLLGDLRYAWRQVARAPGFAAIAILMLGLGIGATTTIFSAINTLFLRPPAHVHHPERLVAIYTSDFSGPAFGSSSHPDYLDFAAGAPALAALAAASPRPFSVAAGRRSFRALGEMVSANYFAVLGVPLALGAGFSGDGTGSDAVIGHGLWQRDFGGDRDVIGRTIRLSGRTFTIVGVAPEGFYGSVRGVRMELWTTLAAQRVLDPADALLSNRGDRGLSLVGRLRDGATIEQVQAQLALVAARLHAAYPEGWTDVSGTSRRVTVLPEREARIFPSIRGPVTQFLGLLMGVAALVLVVCCANLANLLLARATVRRRELAVRLALGGGRSRLVRQLLTEGVVLAALGGGLGAALALWSTDLLRAFQPPLPVPILLEFPLDERILAFTVAVSAATVLLSGLLPALRATRLDAVTALRGELAAGTGVRRFGLRDALVVGQVAVSLVVLSAAGLFLTSLRNAARVDPGFRAEGLATVRLELGVQGYDSARGRAFYAELGRRASGLPGVHGVAFAEMLPLGLAGLRRGVQIEGYVPAEGEEMEFGTNTVSAGYFQVMGIEVVRGRGFEPSDRPGAMPVAVVNQSFARRFWRGEDPIGRRLSTGDGTTRVVVGVVRDGKYRSLGEAAQPHFYQPFEQVYQPDMVLVARGRNEARPLVDPLVGEVRALDPDLPVEAGTVEEHLGLALLPQRIGTAVLGTFGAVAVLLAAFGLFGVMSYVVSQRAREIGIRLALGARARDVRLMVLRRALVLTLAGLVLGLGAAAAAARGLEAFLVGVRPTEPPVLLGAGVLFIAVALLASWLPARRAAAVDPMRALRWE